MLIVISGPSGSGKTTVCSKLLEEMPHVVRSISYTTRTPRAGEVNGKDYFFISREEFERRIKDGAFLEYAKVFDNYYGTDREWILSQKNDVLLNIDVQGASQIKKKFPGAIYIFLMPPTDEILKERLMRRATDDQEEIAKRLAVAKEETEQALNYEYIVINDELEEAVLDIKSIIENHER